MSWDIYGNRLTQGHCEYNIQQERKRLHSIIAKFQNQNGGGYD